MADKPSERPRVGSLSHVGITAKYNFLNYFRARRFYVMLAIILIISGLITALVGYYRPPGFVGGDALGFYGAGWGTFINFVVVLTAVFFGGDAISGEFQNRTGYFLVPNPIRRSAVYVGKWIAALAASTIILAVFALTMVANGLFYFPGSIPWEFVESFAFAWVFMVAALSLAFAFSSLFKSNSISVLMTVIVLLFVFNVVDLVSELVAGIEPWFSITYAAGIVANVLTVPFPAAKTVIPAGPGGRFSIAQFNATIPEGLLILGAYFVVMAVLGLVLFERKEFTS